MPEHETSSALADPKAEPTRKAKRKPGLFRLRNIFFLLVLAGIAGGVYAMNLLQPKAPHMAAYLPDDVSVYMELPDPSAFALSVSEMKIWRDDVAGSDRLMNGVRDWVAELSQLSPEQCDPLLRDLNGTAFAMREFDAVALMQFNSGDAARALLKSEKFKPKQESEKEPGKAFERANTKRRSSTLDFMRSFNGDRRSPLKSEIIWFEAERLLVIGNPRLTRDVRRVLSNDVPALRSSPTYQRARDSWQRDAAIVAYGDTNLLYSNLLNDDKPFGRIIGQGAFREGDPVTLEATCKANGIVTNVRFRLSGPALPPRELLESQGDAALPQMLPAGTIGYVSMRGSGQSFDDHRDAMTEYVERATQSIGGRSPEEVSREVMHGLDRMLEKEGLERLTGLRLGDESVLAMVIDEESLADPRAMAKAFEAHHSTGEVFLREHCAFVLITRCQSETHDAITDAMQKSSTAEPDETNALARSTSLTKLGEQNFDLKIPRELCGGYYELDTWRWRSDIEKLRDTIQEFHFSKKRMPSSIKEMFEASYRSADFNADADYAYTWDGDVSAERFNGTITATPKTPALNPAITKVWRGTAHPQTVYNFDAMEAAKEGSSFLSVSVRRLDGDRSVAIFGSPKLAASTLEAIAGKRNTLANDKAWSDAREALGSHFEFECYADASIFVNVLAQLEEEHEFSAFAEKSQELLKTEGGERFVSMVQADLNYRDARHATLELRMLNGGIALASIEIVPMLQVLSQRPEPWRVYESNVFYRNRWALEELKNFDYLRAKPVLHLGEFYFQFDIEGMDVTAARFLAFSFEGDESKREAAIAFWSEPARMAGLKAKLEASITEMTFDAESYLNDDVLATQIRNAIRAYALSQNPPVDIDKVYAFESKPRD